MRYDRALIEALAEVEHICTQPRGFRKVMQVTLVTLANVLPELTFVGSVIWVLWLYVMESYLPTLFSALSPIFVTLVVLILMQVLIAVLLPLRWAAVRSEFNSQLIARLNQELTNAYAAIPEETARTLLAERDHVDRLAEAMNEVQKWLDERQSQASISGLYGS